MNHGDDDNDDSDDLTKLLTDLARVGVFPHWVLASEAAVSVRLDREGKGQTFSLEFIHDEEKT